MMNIYSYAIFSIPSKKTKSVAFLNEGIRTTFLALKDGVSFYSSVDQVINILGKRPTRAIIKVERTEYKLIEAIKMSPSLNGRVINKLKIVPDSASSLLVPFNNYHYKI